MMKFLFLFLVLTPNLFAVPLALEADKIHADKIKEQKIIKGIKRICLEKYPDAYNPSILKIKEGFLLSFRYVPDRFKSFSYIGIVKLNENLDVISEPVLLDTKFDYLLDSQAEDARLFRYDDKIYLIYNDCPNEVWLGFESQRRDMYMVELKTEGERFVLSKPLKLVHAKKYPTTKVQKNWVPFEWNGQLFLTYSINPHEVLWVDYESGMCHSVFETNLYLNWNYGPLRGSAPPQIVDGEYLSFFHSCIQTVSPATRGEKLWHYYMGAYSFSKSPPFHLTSMSPYPITTKGFYTYLLSWKRVIFPGGFEVIGNNIYLAYGRDDWEIWIATLDKNELKASMVPVYVIDENIFE